MPGEPCGTYKRPARPWLSSVPSVSAQSHSDFRSSRLTAARNMGADSCLHLLPDWLSRPGIEGKPKRSPPQFRAHQASSLPYHCSGEDSADQFRGWPPLRRPRPLRPRRLGPGAASAHSAAPRTSASPPPPSSPPPSCRAAPAVAAAAAAAFSSAR